MLTIRNGPNQGHTIPVTDEPVVLGRQSSATITIDDKKVSREHAIIERTADGACVLRDLESTNHTYLNGRPVRTAVLEEGDVIKVGGTEISFGLAVRTEEIRESEPIQVIQVDPADYGDVFACQEGSEAISLEMSPVTLRRALRSEGTQRGELQECLYSIGLLSKPETAPLDLLSEAMSVVAKIIDFDHWVWIEWCAETETEPQIVAAATADGTPLQADRVQPSRSLLDRARMQNRGIVSDELSQQFEMSMARHPDDIASAVVVPLAQATRQSALYLERTGTKPPFEAIDLERSAILGTTIASALESSRLFAELREAYESLDQYLTQLNKTEKLAAIGRLASGFAHDLNNPLSSVLGFLDLADRVVAKQVEGEAQEKLTKYLGKAQGAADFCRALSRNVLAFARQTPFDDHQDTPFNVHKTIESTLAICDSSLRRTGAEINVDVPDDLTIVGDPSALQQMVMNLVTNASDAIGEAGISNGRIDIRANKSNEVILLEVEDNGPGIPEALRSQIFEPLFTTKGENRGTGLGLFVVSSLIADAGGKIDLRSDTGKGTTFSVEIPERLARMTTDVIAPRQVDQEGPSNQLTSV